ncbi:hypothetical protein EV363DRAFT_1417939 [Boletus edulis]|nr:hypothetical protein EV363DRAFT_1417939 [Boletus edulis]
MNPSESSSSSQTSFNPLGMFEYNDQYAHDQQIHRRWVAEQQGTLAAVLPVHTREGRDLFCLLVSSPLSSDAATRHPNWTSLAAVWATHANGKTIFYKVRDLTTQTAITSLVITLQLPEQSHLCTSPLTTVGLESHCPDGASDDLARHTRGAQSQHDTRNLQSLAYRQSTHQATTRSNAVTTTASRAPLSRGSKRKQAASDADRWCGSAHSGSSAPPPVLQHDMQWPVEEGPLHTNQFSRLALHDVVISSSFITNITSTILCLHVTS